MIIVVLIALLLTVFLGISFVLVFRKLVAEGRDLPPGSDWMQEVSPGRYRPMQRLLDAVELDFLEKHPAISRKIVRQFRAKRMQVFRGYLRNLSLDHSRVCAAIRALMACSLNDRPDLGRLLIRQRLTFTFHFMLAHFRLTLHGLGVGTVNVGNLVAGLERMRLELNSLLVAAQPAAA
jgi:hypothetical protein